MSFEEYYQYLTKLPPFDQPGNELGFPHREGSDESAHMPLLQVLSSTCKTVVEFGMRHGASTSAFLKGLGDKGQLITIDIAEHPIAKMFKRFNLPNWQFIEADTTNPKLEIPDTDLLHLDTLHTYSQVKRELELHGRHALKYLTFHDTVTHGVVSKEEEGGEGINRAIDEWTYQNGFSLLAESFFNNGLRVYVKQ